MNCSESRRLQRLLSRLWQELRGGGGGGAVPVPVPNSSRPDGGAPSPASPWGGADDAYLYILLIMIFYGCLAGGLILAYTRSRKLESKHDPYHLYIERDWTAAGAAGAAAREPSLDEARSSGDSEEHP
ncbi:potassium voltage-gated channel subfamily E regulatory beta subunit 5 [Elgaria multicarinata webbii]|uniref:potassium voltage-gated channel subfamily E regulatory beta subunit 5 n=1 Tax=Elgaria multicarinata webbii TaxID=159646 RepID=UPI002FCCBB91